VRALLDWQVIAQKPRASCYDILIIRVRYGFIIRHLCVRNIVTTGSGFLGNDLPVEKGPHCFADLSS
ncbi:MAG TPA: hypothetical protein VIT23_00525, partial [Terrimicrobiaceae bacterium]